MLVIDQEECLECGGCIPVCPEDALFLSFKTLEFDDELCTACGICIMFCPVGAIREAYAAAV